LADTIRDVTIRIALEMKKATLQVPDLGSGASADAAESFKAAEDATKSAQRAATEYAAQSKRVLDTQKAAVEAVANEWGKIDEGLGDLVRSMGQIAAQNQKLADTEEQLKKVAAAENKAADEAKKLAAESAKASDTLAAFPAEASKNLEEIGVGALKAARGFALLTGNDDIEELVFIFARFQGAIDIVGGLSEATRKLTELYGRAAQAAKAMTVANQALAVSNTSVATTSKGAGVAMLAAFGPQIAVMAILALAIANVVAWYKHFTRGAKEAAEEAKNLRDVAEQINQIQLPDATIADLEERRRRVALAGAREGEQQQAAMVRIKATQLQIDQQIIAEQEKEIDKLDKKLAGQDQLYEKKLRELQISRDLAQAEAEREQSLARRLGTASNLEKIQLENIFKAGEGAQRSAQQEDLLARFGFTAGLEAQARRGDPLLEAARAGGFRNPDISNFARQGFQQDLLRLGATDFDTANEKLAQEFRDLAESDNRIKVEITDIIAGLKAQNQETLTRLKEIADNNQVVAAQRSAQAAGFAVGGGRGR